MPDLSQFFFYVWSSVDIKSVYKHRHMFKHKINLLIHIKCIETCVYIVYTQNFTYILLIKETPGIYMMVHVDTAAV